VYEVFHGEQYCDGAAADDRDERTAIGMHRHCTEDDCDEGDHERRQAEITLVPDLPDVRDRQWHDERPHRSGRTDGKKA
jgi:hypothetical protein